MLDTLFPSYCLSCEELGPFLCRLCKKELKPHPELCPFCHRVSPHWSTCLNCLPSYRAIAGIIIGFQYTGVLKQLIRKLKYNHRRQLAPFLAERLALLAQTHPTISKALHEKKLIITRVPSHRYRRRFIKGYNQSQLLAKHIAEQLNTPCLGLLRKIKHTSSQAKLSRKQRLANLTNAFKIVTSSTNQARIPCHNGKEICAQESLQDGQTILIIDDITTTGSTINELAETIKSTYPKTSIRGCVIGRHGR